MATLNKGRPHLVYLSIVTLSLVFLVITAILHLMNWWTLLVDADIHQKTSPSQWQKYGASAVHSKWILCHWVVVYLLQVVWLLYGLEITLRRPNVEAENETDYTLTILPHSVYIFFNLAMGAIVSWQAVWSLGNDDFRYSPLVMFLVCVFTYIALVISVMRTNQYESRLVMSGMIGRVWETRWIVHNALAALAALSTVTLFLLISVVVKDVEDMEGSGAWYVYIGFSQVYILVWFVVDFFFSDLCLRFVFTPYPVCLLVQLQVVLLHRGQEDSLLVVSGILLGLSSFLCCLKLWQMIMPSCTKFPQ